MLVRDRVKSFMQRYGLAMPILQAPMAGRARWRSRQPSPMPAAWARDFRDQSNGGFQLSLWIPDPPPQRNATAEAKTRDFLSGWGPPVDANAGEATPPDFAAQCDALIVAGPRAVSSIMGLFPS